MTVNKYLCLPFILLLLLGSGCRSSVLDDPSTAIGFSIPVPSHVKVTVTNNYNTVVATLVDGDFTNGIFTASFNSSGLLEGIYYYTIEADGIGNSYHYKHTTFLLMIK
jgi:hypothetical protein